jgi:hypothetical protein
MRIMSFRSRGFAVSPRSKRLSDRLDQIDTVSLAVFFKAILSRSWKNGQRRVKLAPARKLRDGERRRGRYAILAVASILLP